jgi:hypothetical protein
LGTDELFESFEVAHGTFDEKGTIFSILFTSGDRGFSFSTGMTFQPLSESEVDSGGEVPLSAAKIGTVDVEDIELAGEGDS